MKLTWLSNCPWTPTGYGVQTALFTQRLQAEGHKMAVISNWGHEGNAIMWNGIQVFGRSFHPYAQDIMHSHSKTWDADAMISLMDTWVFEPNFLQGTKWIPWFPVDSEPIPRAIVNTISKAFARIAMSKWGQKQAESVGLDSYYVPLGVDTNEYKPIDQTTSREQARMPKDKFIIGMVAMNKGNPSRKAFHQTIAAFAALQKKYGDCVLYLHTVDGLRNPAETVNLPAFCDAMGLKYSYAFAQNVEDADVIFADQYRMALGYPVEAMAKLYSSFDVLSSVTMGEGFGIPIVEAQSCGTPVIVGNWTAMAELCFSGWKVDKSETEPLFNNLFSFHYIPRIAAIAEKMDAAYQMRGNQEYRKRARKAALAYDADKITEKYWKPVLADIEEKIKNEPKKDRLQENLDMLR